jgi:hypothetical protein
MNAYPAPAHLDLLLSPCRVCAESLLSPDALRTVTLIAQDTANLSIALGASSKVAADWWRALAAKHAPAGVSIDADTPAREGGCVLLPPAVLLIAGLLLTVLSEANRRRMPACASTAAALAVVQQAVRADVARAQSCTKSDAKATYRLTDKDLSVSGWLTACLLPAL